MGKTLKVAAIAAASLSLVAGAGAGAAEANRSRSDEIHNVIYLLGDGISKDFLVPMVETA